MHAAANTKGGVGGVSQAVGKEFSASDKPGKLPPRKSHSQRLYKGGSVDFSNSTAHMGGYAEGGEVEASMLDIPGVSQIQKTLDDAAKRAEASKKAPAKGPPSSRLYKGYAEGGEVRQSEAERDKALEGYRRLRGELRDAPPGVRDYYRESTRDKFKVEGAKKPETIDVDEAADQVRANRPKGFIGHLQRNRRGDDSVDRKMDTDAQAPGTMEYNEVSDKERASRADDSKDEIELARGGKIIQVAGKPIGKDDGLIAAQRGEYVVRKAAVKKLGLKVMDEINRGRLPRSERMYGRRAAHG